VKIEDFVSQVKDFDKLNATERIRLFAWYLHTYCGDEAFTTSDINRCFDELHIHRPSNTSQLILALVGRDLIKQGQGFRLSRPSRQTLDAKLLTRTTTVAVHQLLQGLPALLTLPDQSDYLEEALVCFRHQAFRAAVVMTWNVTYDHLTRTVADKHLAKFNQQLSGMFGGKKGPVTTLDDFQRLKESEVIEVCNAASLISKEVAKTLNEKLGKRNSAAHASGAKFDQLQTEAFISDLINNAMLRIA
jgi:hypothetical protein